MKFSEMKMGVKMGVGFGLMICMIVVILAAILRRSDQPPGVERCH